MSSSSQRRELPAWYYRVSALTVFTNAEIYSYYFDEDISDLDESNDESNDEVAEVECDCDSEDECECYAEDDGISERSYDGSDADWYYELKDLREDRKRQLRSLAKQKQDTRHYESRKEEEVRAAYKALKKAEKEGETLYISSLAGKNFRLYSTDHLDHYPLDDWEQSLSKYVEFYTPDHSLEIPDREVSENTDRRTVQGHVYLDGSTGCSFLPFRSPTRPSREKRVLKSCDGKYNLMFQFISDEYFRLKVSRELVFDGHQGPIPKSAPEVFEFMGILRNLEKEKEERLEWERKNRPPSPRETWFEMNHPMGWWNQSRFS